MEPFKRYSDGSVGVEHNSELCAHGLGGEICMELCSYCSAVSVSFDNSAPDDSKSGVVLGLLCLVDVGYSLAEVEASILLINHTLDLEKSELFMLGGLSSLEAGEHSLGVESKNEMSSRISQRGVLTSLAESSCTLS